MNYVYIKWLIHTGYIVSTLMTCARVYEIWPSLSQGKGQKIGQFAKSYRFFFKKIQKHLLVAHLSISLIYLVVILTDFPVNKGEAMTWIFELTMYSLSLILSTHFVYTDINNKELILPNQLQQVKQTIYPIIKRLSQFAEEHLPMIVKFIFLTHLIDLGFRLIFH